MTITATARPYVLTAGQHSYPLSAREVQRLLDAYTPVQASPNKITLRILGVTSIIRPATRGGGAAFTVETITPITPIPTCGNCNTPDPTAIMRQHNDVECDRCYAATLAHGALHVDQDGEI